MKEWYENHIALSTWICDNCGDYIPHSQEWQCYAAQCHILDKRTYHSVKLHPDNHLHLCSKCHNNFDSSYAKKTTMKVWPVAVLRILLFIKLVTERLPKVLADLLNSE